MMRGNYFDYASMLRESRIPRRLRRRIGRRVGRGLQDRPVLTVAMLAVALAIGAVLVVMLVTLALAAVVAVALGIGAYRIGRRIVSREPRVARFPASGHAAPIGSGTDTLHRYLDVTEEFGRLCDRVLAEPVEAPAQKRPVGEASAEARRLQRTAEGLLDDWHGASEIRACLDELVNASESLARYADALQSRGSRRLSAAELQWQRDDLARRRDHLIERLRATDFRGQEATPLS
jgi:hypothetical protein